MKKNKQLQKLIQELVRVSFINGKVIESKVVRSLTLLKRLPRSQSIFALSEYLKQLKRLQKQYTLYIESAVKLSQNEISKVKKAFERKTKINEVIVDINPRIIGGLKIKVGDQIWDDSILDKIEQIREALRG